MLRSIAAATGNRPPQNRQRCDASRSMWPPPPILRDARASWVLADWMSRVRAPQDEGGASLRFYRRAYAAAYSPHARPIPGTTFAPYLTQRREIWRPPWHGFGETAQRQAKAQTRL